MDHTSATADPFVSLVVATLGTEVLGELLDSLCALQGGVPFEVIVVDQNGDDRLVPIVARFRERLAIAYARVDFKGASLARNHGAGLARGRWVGFPDDDCRLRPDTLAAMHRAVETGAEVITGRTVDESGKASVLRWGKAPERFSRWTMFRCVTECTLFVERRLFASAGGFDPAFGPGGPYPAAEGIDLVNRLLGPAGHGYFSPAIEFVHASKVPPWTEWAVERFGRYAIGDGALIAKSRSLPMLYWGTRTVLSAFANLAAADHFRRAAYGARLRGLLEGYRRYRRAAGR
jgi:glycosyltransferase involved in cell wall biosynthesis